MAFDGAQKDEAFFSNIMARQRKKTASRKRSLPQKASQEKPPVSQADLDRLEFHRNAAALMPDSKDKHPGIAIQVETVKGIVGQRFCSCSTRHSQTCSHLREMPRILSAYRQQLKSDTPADDFRASFWHRFAETMTDGFSDGADIVRLAAVHGSIEALSIMRSSGERLLTYFSQAADRSRFLERCTVTGDDAQRIPTRGHVISQLSQLTLTEDEWMLRDRGFKTRRQILEESFWYKMAYHAYREFSAGGCKFHPAIEKNTGNFVLQFQDAQKQCPFAVNIPRRRVKSILNALKGVICNAHDLDVDPIPIDAIFDIRLSKNLDLEIQPLLRLVQKDGEAKFFDREDLKRFQYGDLYYIEELGILAEDQYPKLPPEKFNEAVKTVINRSRVPAFLEEFKTDSAGDTYRIDDTVKRLKIIRNIDRIEITPELLERDWCWLSARYGVGSQWISLADILTAKKAKLRYVSTDEGWIDVESPEFNLLDTLADRILETPRQDQKTGVRLSRMDILRLAVGRDDDIAFRGDADRVSVLNRLCRTQPSVPLPELAGMTSRLRDYQKRGAEWLMFLFENGFGGLLCDDMGLGKTHQAMALMVWLRERKAAAEPFLLVCPTTVISHWHRKLNEHAPGIKAIVYHGGNRDLMAAIEGNDIILTSYGVLQRDAEPIKRVYFAAAVFDEIQNIKNRETKTYQAAENVQARIKLGLTGTPVENSLVDLKTLLDLTVPGYLGTDNHFLDRYLIPIEEVRDASRREELSRLVSPFVLRRLKKTVLKELPEKIEDIRICELSEDQIKLYQDAISRQGAGLMKVLRESSQPIPYLHIFALLGLLKQICNHPATVKGALEDYSRYKSGKWELFTELLSESLDSGQKVVVYSQYLGMLDIMESYLTERKVGFAKLTGTSRNRGNIIDRFNTDADCRVFLGSLKAGGTGIDLVAASVVIHYDRWWNAAREDQATDRVHRIGQRRGVQVFKLVTLGTLEEKIAAIIEKKRNLMNGVVKEDAPGLLKSFTREQLLDMLSLPA
ncbi:MAG: DEAD/DEAH box helicase [Desulfobacterales bacterium]|nr:DEAD/DEAH box helicase [Desulfobacterales bacterium]